MASTMSVPSVVAGLSGPCSLESCELCSLREFSRARVRLPIVGIPVLLCVEFISPTVYFLIVNYFVPPVFFLLLFFPPSVLSRIICLVCVCCAFQAEYVWHALFFLCIVACDHSAGISLG